MANIQSNGNLGHFKQFAGRKTPFVACILTAEQKMISGETSGSAQKKGLCGTVPQSLF